MNPHLTPLFIQVHSTQAVFARTKHSTREVVFYLARTPLFDGNKENIDCLCLVVRAGVIIEAGDRKLKIIATFQQHFSTITFHPAVSFPLFLSFSITRPIGLDTVIQPKQPQQPQQLIKRSWLRVSQIWPNL